MKVIGYLRVSTDEQARSGLGLEAQRAAITAQATAHGWDVEWAVDDGASARSLDRPRLQAALETLAARRADALVVAKLDRLSRSMHDFSGLLDTAARHRWAVVALDMGIDTSNMTGRLVAHVLMAVAEWEREAIAARTSDAIQARLARGEDWGRRSETPAEVEDRICVLRAEGATYAAIADALTSEGVPTPRGGERWHPATISRILRRRERQGAAV